MFNDLLWYSKQGQSNQTGAAQPNGPSWSQANERIRVMKDQLIAAKAYLNSAPPNSNSDFVKDLRQLIKELEHVVGEAKRDSDLSKR